MFRQTFPQLYSNWVKCLGETFKMDGLKGLYAGTLPALIANVAENAVLFTAYGYCQKVDFLKIIFPEQLFI
jgi:solute carrier family 25 ornithine transporter 2/15